jgi:hypothetical protein
MLNAKEARALSNSTLRDVAVKSIESFRADLGSALQKAASEGMVSASLVIPYPLSEDTTTLQGLILSLKRAGYKAKLSFKTGTLAKGVYMEPRTVLTLFW